MTAQGTRWRLAADRNALFGSGPDLAVLTGLLEFVARTPDEIGFGRFLPAAGGAFWATCTTSGWLPRW